MHEELSPMEQKLKNILAIIGTISIISIIIFAGWKLFFSGGTTTDPGKDPNDYRNTAESIRGSLSTISREQQAALDATGRIESGLSISERILGELGEGIRTSQTRVDGITKENRRINESVRSAQERNRSAEVIINDSQRRIGECQQIIQDVRAAARSKGKDSN